MPGAAESSGLTHLPHELSSGASCLHLHISSDMTRASPPRRGPVPSRAFSVLSSPLPLPFCPLESQSLPVPPTILSKCVQAPESP